ncbi:MAG: hypothetical protein HYR73_03790, partial [Candidatus Eisenbacteria bacterium]|nr:hypothetical protein [Candidatus Eisenbacteria bacterium]
MSAARPSIIAAREPRPGQAAEHARRDARHGRIAVVALAIGAPATVALVVVSLVIGAITDWFPAAARAASVTQPAGSSPLVKPWTPPPADSVVSWAGEARAGFQANTGDSVGGENFPAYQRVALIGRRMLESLTRAHMSQASAIEPAIRALGLTIDVERDPAQPTFLLLMVRNPYRLSAGSVGFFYWWQGDKLRYQGARFRPGCEVRMRVWWTAHAEAPYLCGIVERSRDREHTLSLMLLRMSPDAQYWDVVQFPGDGPDLSPGGVADWQDVNDDGVPELVAWLRAPSDSLFADCPGCPQLYAGRVFTLHATGFEVEDERPLSTLTATFQSFIRRLTDHHRAAALELVARGTLVDSAI